MRAKIWRDHLLAGALIAADAGYDEGAFVFLAPEGNVACWRAVAKYRQHLVSDATFITWTLEGVARAIAASGDVPWCAELVERYLAFDRVDELLGRALSAGPREPYRLILSGWDGAERAGGAITDRNELGDLLDD